MLGSSGEDETARAASIPHKTSWVSPSAAAYAAWADGSACPERTAYCTHCGIATATLIARDEVAKGDD